MDLEIDVLERPEFLDDVALYDLLAAKEIDRFAAGAAKPAAEKVAKIGVALNAASLTEMPEEIVLGQIFDGDDWC